MKRASIEARALLAFLAISVLVGCANPGVPLPPELELPRRVGDLHASRKGDKVYLSWSVPGETMDHQTIRHLGPTRICRSLDFNNPDCDHPVAELPASAFRTPAKPKKGQPPGKVQASYTDTIPSSLQREHPTDLLNYAVSILNQSGRSAGPSNIVQIPAAPTLAPPTDLTAQVTAGGVLLRWTSPSSPDLPGIHFAVRIYRRPVEAKADVVAGEMSLSGNQGEYLDQTFEWEKDYIYHASVVTTAVRPGAPEVQVEGDDSPSVQAFAHDVFPPQVPSGLQAVASGVGQKPFVDLIWGPVADADLAGYNVYRNEPGAAPVKVNAELIKTPAYRDANVNSGHEYVYSVTAVDLRGNESGHSEQAGEKMP